MQIRGLVLLQKLRVKAVSDCSAGLSVQTKNRAAGRLNAYLRHGSVQFGLLSSEKAFLLIGLA